LVKYLIIQVPIGVKLVFRHVALVYFDTDVFSFDVGAKLK